MDTLSRVLCPQPPEPLGIDNLAFATARAFSGVAVLLEQGAAGILVLLVANVAYAGRSDATLTLPFLPGAPLQPSSSRTHAIALLLLGAAAVSAASSVRSSRRATAAAAGRAALSRASLAEFYPPPGRRAPPPPVGSGGGGVADLGPLLTDLRAHLLPGGGSGDDLTDLAAVCAAVGVEFDASVDGVTPARMLGKALEARRAVVG